MTILQILSVSIFLVGVSCTLDITIDDNKSLNEASVKDTIAFEELTMEDGNSTIKNFYMYKNLPYTGQAVTYEMAVDGKWSFVYSFEDGIMLRMDVWGMNGYQHRFVEMKDGYEYHMVMFHRNGNRYLETFYDKNRIQIGVWSRWHESGELDWCKSYD